MAAADAGRRPRLDHATVSLRLALLHAEEDADRLRALQELARGTVLAATWPNAPEALRTLTNSDGEKAMPLFSGMDTLQVAARRFGWMNPDGSFPFRELPAREALESAIAQGVHYAVLDIYADHAAEFAYHELAQVLQQPPSAPRQGAGPRAQAQPGRAPVATGGAAPSPLLAEIDMPFASGNAPRAAAAVRARPPTPAPFPTPTRPPTPAPFRAPARPLTPAPFAAPAAARRPPTPAPFPAPARPPTPAPFAAPAAARRPPTPPAFAAAAAPAANLPSLDGPSLDGAPSFGFGLHEPEPEARPAALEAAAMVAQVAKLADDAETQQAAAELTAMLTDMARKGVADEAPSSAQSAAKTLAGLLAGELAADAKRAKRADATRPDPTRPDAVTSEEDAPLADASEEAGLRPLDPGLPEPVLDAVAEALRTYPEVEWACEVSDGGELPVIGLRIDPAFQARAGQIRSAVMSAAQNEGRKVSAVLLNDPQDLKDARKYGHAFFPWRKRAGKR